MALDFDVSPYYDNFDPKKNFYRILFKPGYAVQARELTQSQSILQDQVSKFGLGMFADGSKVSGGNITVDTNVVTAKLVSSASSIINNVIGFYAVGATSGFIAQVNSVDASNYYIITKLVNISNGSSFASGETINFYSSKIDALNSLTSTITPQFTSTTLTTATINRTVTGTYLSQSLTMTTSGISVGDSISISSINFLATVVSIDSTSSLTINKPLPSDVTNAAVVITNEISVKALEVNIDDGVWFTNGVFVESYAASIVPNSLSVYPSVVVGYTVDETIVDSTSDPSLLDPAIGASNYQAPGADRYTIQLVLASQPYVSDQTIAFGSLTNSKFIELVRINAGTVEDIVNVPVLTDVSAAIAQSVSDTSGDFIVKPFNLRIVDSVPGSNATSNVFFSTISSGKVYLNGYPVEHRAPTNYVLAKARDINVLSSQQIDTYYGNYTKIQNLNGEIPNFQVGTQVELHNVHFSLANTNTKIGTGRIRDFDYDSGSLTSTEYKAFMFDVKLANSSFSNVQSLIIPGAANSYTNVTFSANTVTSANLIDNTYQSLIFPLPQNNISNVSSVNYSTRRYFTAPLSGGFVNGSYVITTNGSNEQFFPGTGTITSSQAQLYFSVVTGTTNGSYTAGQFIPMDSANVTITINNGAATPQATINIGGNYTGNGTIYATIGVTNDTIKSKTLQSNVAILVSANTINTAIDVGYSDVYNYVGVYELGNTANYVGAWSNTAIYSSNTYVSFTDGHVYMSTANTNVANTPNTIVTVWSKISNNIANYTLDNGQRDTLYDHGKITNISGSPKGNVVVTLSYFTHSGGTCFFDVNSYPVTYPNIPTFTSPQYGTTYNLRDVIDFRPRRTDGIGQTGLNTFQLPSPFADEFITATYGYYLSRTDKIVLYPNGQFKTITGTSSYTNPVTPPDVPGTLTLFTLNYAPYTFSKHDIILTPNIVRKYSMRDIGVLDKRIGNLEQYTSLSILENQVTGSDVTDSTGLNLLFKNGYLVDGFTGSSVGDVKNPDYVIAIDPVAQLARPTFLSNVANYYVNQSQGTFVTSPGNKTNNQLSINNNLITFSYDEASLVYQNVATEVISVNPFNVYSFHGDATISPSSDVWYSTTTQPNINITTEDQSAWTAAVNGTGNGSQWNDWQLNWTGQPTDTVVNSSDQASITRDTTAIQNAISSQGLTSALQGGPIQVSSTNQILSSAVIPYARSVPVSFTVNGMVPYTPIHTYINGINVDGFVTPGFTDRVYNLVINNAGSGYTNGNNLPIISITGANTTPAIYTANVSSGQIVSLNLVQTGAGYTSTPIVSVTGSNTVQAILTVQEPSQSSQLVTDINGSASGTLTIPNGVPAFSANVANTLGVSMDISANVFLFPTGTLKIEWSDSYISPALSHSYATSSFYSQGTLQTVQTTVVSTRPPQATAVPQPQVVDVPNDPGPPPDNGGDGNTGWQPALYGSGTDPQTTIITKICMDGESIISRGGFGNGTQGVAGFQGALFNSTGSTPSALFNSIVNAAQTITGETSPGPATASGYGTSSLASTIASLGEQIWTTAVSQGVDASTLTETSPVVQQVLAAASSSATSSASTNATAGAVDPLSQNFYVNAAQYPNGVFLSSVDLYFATVDPTIPVSVRVRPTVNGYPDAVNEIPGSIVYMNPSDINVPSTSSITNSIGPATTFTFDHPIYLAPGQYSLMIASNSNNYSMYSSKVGQIIFGQNATLSQLNYAASLFKSQNASTWIPAPSETLCFNLKICDFAGGSVTFDVTANSAPATANFDLLQLMNNDLSFNGLDSISYSVKTTNLSSNTLSSAVKVVPHQNYNFSSRQTHSTSGDLIVEPTVTNADRWTSPAIDLDRLNTILVQNVITPYYSANTVSESLGGFHNGNAVARYITRRVTLNNNFQSTGLTVYMDVNRQIGTKIEVYYKVLNSNDANNFDNNPYVLMNPILTPGSGVIYTDATSYTSDTYQALNITYNDLTTNALYNNFNVFAIKVVMYSSNPSIVPQIKNFRAIATA